jgi:hypothetical protein
MIPLAEIIRVINFTKILPATVITLIQAVISNLLRSMSATAENQRIVPANTNPSRKISTSFLTD